MKPLAITKLEAQRLLLAWQNLWPPRTNKGQGAIMDYIGKVGCIQYDPLNIAGFNHDLALQARICNYRPEMIYDLLYTQRTLLDGWDKNMSIYPTSDWPYFKRYRQKVQSRLRSEGPVQAILPKIRQELAKRGPLSSLDLDLDETVEWYWAPTRLARAALESAYTWGELIVHHKVHTRKYYDFAKSHIPQTILDAPEPNPTEPEYIDWYVLRRIGSIGMLWNKGSDAWLGTNLKAAERTAAFKRLAEKGTICPLSVQGLNQTMYIKKEALPLLDISTPQPQAVILAPLDNLLWDRNLVSALFDFQYRWEVYKPAAERKYGYYVLPVLYGDRFIARFEPGRNKETGALMIKNWWWETGVAPDPKMAAALTNCFHDFLHFLGASALEYSPGQNVASLELAKLLERVFQGLGGPKTKPGGQHEKIKQADS